MKFSFRKGLCVFFATAMFAILAGGCADNSGPGGATDTTKDSNGDSSGSGKTKIVLWGMDESDVLLSAIAQYEADHPNVRFSVESQGETTLEMAISANTAPDILMTPSDYVATYGKKGYILDLAEYGANDLKPLFAENCWTTANGAIGKTYSLPFDSNIINFIYNKDMFDQAGAKVPTNYQEFREAAQKIKAKYNSDEYKAYTVGAFDSLGSVGYKAWGTFHYYWWLWRMGGDIFNEDMSDTTIDSDIAVETLQMLIDLKNDGLAAGTYQNTEFLSGKVAMIEYVTKDFFNTVLKTQSGNYEVAMMPTLKDDVPPVTGLGLYCYCVTSKSKNPEIAYDFLKYYTTSKEYQISYCKPNYFIPSLLEAQQDPYYNTPDWTIILDQAQYARATPGVNNWHEMDDAIYEAIQLAAAGTKTPQEALTAAANQIRQLMK